MPIIGSMGQMSSKGFGQFASVTLAPGTIAMIMPSNNYYKYIFANDTATFFSTAGTNTLAANQTSAVGNSTKGWFVVRSNQNGFLYVELRYWAAFKGYKNISLVPSQNAVSNAGAGNGTTGVMTSVASDSIPATTSVLSYASNTIIGGTTLGGPCQTGEAVASPTYALFGLMGTSLPQTNKYAFADNSVTQGTNLSFNTTLRCPSIGNAVAGIFCQGGASSNTCKYVHANDVCAPSTSLLRPTTGTRAFNNAETGIISRGGNTTAGVNTMLWTFANDSVAASTLNNFIIQCGAANGILGVSA